LFALNGRQPAPRSDQGIPDHHNSISFRLGRRHLTNRLAVKIENIRRNLADSLSPLLPSYFPVAWKLGLSISLLISVSMAVLGTWLLNNQVTRMQSQADTFGRAIATQLADTAREPMLAEDDFTLKVLVNNLVRSETLKGAAVFSMEGTAMDEAGLIPPSPEPDNARPEFHWESGSEPLTTYFVPVEVKGITAGFAAVTLSGMPIATAKQQVREAIVTATLLMILVAVVVAFVVSRRLSRPINTLLAAASAMRSGDLHYRISERRNDEIGMLADAYNNMATGLLEKNQVERVLSRFVSPTVARQMMADLHQVQLGGRDVNATVLFADIVGFTRLSESISPDEVAELLNAYFDAITLAATFYRGTIDKYMGDCAMIVFGVPEHDPEHLYHGLCCATMIQRLVQRLNIRRQARGLTTVTFRVGVNSGHMLAGNLGSRDRMQYTVVGDSVNLASRLSNMARGGQILVPETLLRDANVASRVRGEPAGHMDVRGKSEPFTTWNVEGVHAHSETLMEQRIAEIVETLMERHHAEHR
jgi:adenylate cyclase